jgi:ABC-type sugar transport system permease subunit
VNLDFGYGSALAVALMIITLLVSSILFVMRTRRVH